MANGIAGLREFLADRAGEAVVGVTGVLTRKDVEVLLETAGLSLESVTAEAEATMKSLVSKAADLDTDSERQRTDAERAYQEALGRAESARQQGMAQATDLKNQARTVGGHARTIGAALRRIAGSGTNGSTPATNGHN